MTCRSDDFVFLAAGRYTQIGIGYSLIEAIAGADLAFRDVAKAVLIVGVELKDVRLDIDAPLPPSSPGVVVQLWDSRKNDKIKTLRHQIRAEAFPDRSRG